MTSLLSSWVTKQIWMLRDTWEALFFFVPWENRQLFSGSQRRRRSSSLSTPSSLYRMLCQVSNECRWCIPSVSETREVSSIHSLFFSPVPFMSSSESRVEIEKRKANIACHSDDSVSIQGNIQLRLWDYEEASSLFLSVAACGNDSQISHNTLVSGFKHFLQSRNVSTFPPLESSPFPALSIFAFPPLNKV